MKRMAVVVCLLLLGGSVMAQITEMERRDHSGAYAGKTVHVGALALTLRSDASEHFGAGDMPTLTFVKDAGGRDVSIVTDKGDAVADIHIRGNGHADRIELGNGLKLSVVRQGNNAYQETLVGPGGKVLKDRVLDPTRRKPAEPLVLDPVARQLGLSAKWRDEISVESVSDSTSVVKEKSSGKTLLYVVRDGPNKVGFDAAGTPLYYDVAAMFLVGPMSNPEELANLEPLLPNRFIFTRDGRVGAYVYTPAVMGIYSFWTEKDASGGTIVQYRSGESGTGGAAGASASQPSNDGSAVRRRLRPVPMDYCVIDYQVTDWSDGSQTITILGETCYYSVGGGGGGTTGGTSGGGGGGAVGPDQISGNATLYQAVNTGINSAQTKLANSQCAALFSSLTTTSPQSGGTPLIDILHQRGATDPTNYLMNFVGYYSGQTKTDSSGSAPCQVGSRYAWTTPGQSSVWVCDLFTQLNATPGMAGDIVLHELLHTLGLPEGGANQWTNQQITDQVVAACGQ